MPPTPFYKSRWPVRNLWPYWAYVLDNMLGKTRLLDRNYKGAASAFSAYERDFPEGEQIGAARYWMGEALYNQDDFAGSADYFTKVHNSPLSV